MKIAVVGAGAMGRWAVKELGLSADVTEIVVGDFNEEQAREVAASHGGGKAAGRFVDARDQESVRAAIAGCDAMVNATQHFWNITVMRAAAAAGVHYTDMGGLFHVTKQQVELHEEFRRAGVTAVIAMGGAPGVTNILAKYGADRLDVVEEAHALCGNVDHTDWSSYDGWVVPYSLETLCDEFSVVAPEFIDGHWVMDITGGEGRRTSTSASRPACSRRTTRSTPSRSLSGTRGRTRASGRRPSSSRCRPSSPARCAFSTLSA